MTLLCLALSAAATFPFFFISRSPNATASPRLWMPITNDMILHFEQMKSFYRGLAAGELYPRWEDDTNRGFGAPTTSYYPPGVYYLTSALYAISGNWMVTLLVAYFLMMAASGAAIYIFVRRFLSQAASIATVVCYVFLPYHLLDQYHRGALAECLAFLFMPFMLLFAEKLLAERKPIIRAKTSPTLKESEHADLQRSDSAALRVLLNIGCLSLTVGCFVWCHPPTAYQFMLAFGLFVMLSALIHKRWKGVMAVMIAVALGLALSGAYLYPAFVEQGLIRHEFVSNTWPYHSTYLFARGTTYDLFAFAWIVNVAAVAIGGVVLLVLEPELIKTSIGLRGRIWVWVIIGCYASFMITPASFLVSRLIPRIEIGVFAWRMLGITTLIAALVAGACAQAALNARRGRTQRAGNSLASLATVTIVGGSIFLALRIIAGNYGAPAFATADEHINLAMMPKTGPVEPLELPKVERAELADGHGSVDVEDWRPEHRVLNLELSAPDKLLIRTFNFPGWQAMVDGEVVPIQSGNALRVELENSNQVLIRAATFRGGAPSVEGMPGKIIETEPLGDIEVQLNPGIHRVTLDYILTPQRRVGVLISSCSLVLVLGLLLGSWIMRLRLRHKLIS
ncbi:MAG TPA: 6-pyruvoyl-tetrahydropterin synthase-related protein [Blastocatellia bacterium]|nr:6-pyruvoyl-tetrahydropterin synthase-related protein [Blastocatellia bacterium]